MKASTIKCYEVYCENGDFGLAGEGQDDVIRCETLEEAIEQAEELSLQTDSRVIIELVSRRFVKAIAKGGEE